MVQEDEDSDQDAFMHTDDDADEPAADEPEPEAMRGYAAKANSPKIDLGVPHGW
jgi:hypothetical protein